MSPLSQVITITIFTVIYLIFLLRQALKNNLDLHDFILLSTIAIIPLLFIVALPVAYFLSELVGIAFPFVLLFGILFVFAFLAIHRLLAKVNKLNLNNIKLVQELALLEERLNRRK